MNTITITLNNEKVEIAKMPIGRLADLLRQIKKIAPHLANFDSLAQDELITKLPDLIADSLPELIEILSIATGTSVDDLAKCGIDDIIKLIDAIYKVNNVTEIAALIKKALAHLPKNQLQPTN